MPPPNRPYEPNSSTAGLRPLGRLKAETPVCCGLVQAKCRTESCYPNKSVISRLAMTPVGDRGST